MALSAFWPAGGICPAGMDPDTLRPGGLGSEVDKGLCPPWFDWHGLSTCSLWGLVLDLKLWWSHWSQGCCHAPRISQVFVGKRGAAVLRDGQHRRMVSSSP